MQHDNVKSCTRPMNMREGTAPASGPIDAIETLPLDMSPVAKEYKENPPVEFPPDPLPPRKFAKFARRDSCATLALGATSSKATMNETGDGEPSEPMTKVSASEPTTEVGEPAKPEGIQDPAKPADSVDVGGSLDDVPGDLFHGDSKITRVEQMAERDRLKNESKAKKKDQEVDDEEVKPRTKSEKAAAAKEKKLFDKKKKQLAKEANKKAVAEAKRAAREAKKATKAANKEKDKALKAIARAKAKAKSAPKSKAKAKSAPKSKPKAKNTCKEGDMNGEDSVAVSESSQAETEASAEPKETKPGEEKQVKKRAPRKNSIPVDRKATKVKSTKAVEKAGDDEEPPAAPPVPSHTAEEGDDKEPEVVAKEKKTFARRNRPKMRIPAARFDAIREIFEKDIQEKVKTPSSMEVWETSDTSMGVVCKFC